MKLKRYSIALVVGAVLMMGSPSSAAENQKCRANNGDGTKVQDDNKDGLKNCDITVTTTTVPATTTTTTTVAPTTTTSTTIQTTTSTTSTTVANTTTIQPRDNVSPTTVYFPTTTTTIPAERNPATTPQTTTIITTTSVPVVQPVIRPVVAVPATTRPKCDKITDANIHKYPKVKHKFVHVKVSDVRSRTHIGCARGNKYVIVWFTSTHFSSGE